MKRLKTLNFSLMLLVFIHLIALRNAVAEEPPKKKAPEDQRFIIFAQVNQSVTLKCPVESSPDFTIFVEWIKGNVSLYNEQGYEITPKGYLKIKSAADKHSGIYTCEAVNGYGSVRVNLTLLVVDQELDSSYYASPHRNAANRVHSSPPSIIKRPSSITTDVGGEATFHCISSGQPVPRIFWLKDGQLIQGSNSYISKRKIHSTLKLKGLKKSDAGDYKCIARNMRGEDEMDYKLHLSDSSPPPKIITLDPPNVTVQKGATIAFVCEVDSRPGVQRVHIKWLKKQDGIDELPESTDINLFRSGTQYYRPLNLTDNELILNGNVYISKLFIRNSCEEDSGTYVCLALNDKGFNFKNSSLKVIAAPEKLINQSHFLVSSTHLAVIITVGFLALLTMLVLVPHLCCRSKSDEKRKIGDTSIPNIDSGSLKQSMTSVRKPNKGDNLPYPEINDPPSTSKLLSIDSTFLYDHSESQISKTTHIKNPFH